MRDDRVERRGRRHRLQQGLQGRDDEPGRRGPAEPLDHAEPAAEDLVAGRCASRGQAVPGGQDLGHDAGEGRHVVAEVVDVADVRQDDHERLRRVQSQRRGGERARRSPGAVDRGAAAVLQRGEDLRKARRALDHAGQVLELARRRLAAVLVEVVLGIMGQGVCATRQTRLGVGLTRDGIGVHSTVLRVPAHFSF